MKKREYLVDKLKAILKEEYDKDELEKDVFSPFDKGQCSMATLAAYLTDYVKKDVVQQLQQELDQVGMWSKEQPQDPNSDYLKWEVAAMLGRKYKHKEAEEQLLKPYEDNPAELKPQTISAFLKKEGVADSKIEELMKSLDARKFWEVNVDPLTYQNEQNTLNNYEDDYAKIPEQKSSSKKPAGEAVGKEKGSDTRQQPVEKYLLRCLIMALLLEHEAGLITPKTPEFKKQIQMQDLKPELENLKNAVIREGRMNTKLAKYLEQATNYDPSAQKTDITSSAYDNLVAAKKELMPIDVADLCRLIAETQSVEREIEGKKILLFIGETGSGKTTTIKSLLGYKMGKKKFKGMNWITIVEPVTDKKVLRMHSNPSCKSVTRHIVAVKPKPGVESDGYYLADTPGWGDTAGAEVQLANIIGVNRALRRCQAVIPVIVISSESWGTRGLGIRNLAKTVASLFQQYEQIKGSVEIIMNRFPPEEMEQMSSKFQNLINEMEESDKANSSYVAFLNHLKRLATNKKLISFDPLKDNPTKLLNDILEKSAKAPTKIFRNAIPSVEVVKSFCTSTTNRIKYHLKVNNPLFVKYFIDSMEQLQEALNDDVVHNSLAQLKAQIKSNLTNEYKRISEEFGYKAKSFTLLKGDIAKFFADVKNILDGKGYNKIIDGLDFNKDAEAHLLSIMKEQCGYLARPKSKQEEDDSRNKHTIDTIKLIYENKASDLDIAKEYKQAKKQIEARAEAECAAYQNQLENGRYDTATDQYALALRYSKYKVQIQIQGGEEAVTKTLEQLKKSLLVHVRKLCEEGMKCCSSRIFNADSLTEPDRRLSAICSSHRLLACLEEADSVEVHSLIHKFEDKLKELSEKQYEALVKILQEAHNNPINSRVVGEFEAHFRRLQDLQQKVGSIKLHVKMQIDQVNSFLASYIESQRILLVRTGEMIKNPQTLKENIEDIQRALKGIEYLAQFGNENLRKQTEALMKDTLDKLKNYLPRILSILTDKSGLRFNSQNCNDIFQKICQAKEMEGVFEKLDNFQSELSQLTRQNELNKKNLKGAMDEAAGVLAALQATETRRDEEKYMGISLSNINLALKFVELISLESPFEDLRAEALNLLVGFKTLMKDLREHYRRSISSFRRMILESEKQADSRESNPQQSTIRVKRDRVGERCRQIWRWARRVYLQVRDIQNNYQSVNIIGEFFADEMMEQFHQEVEGIYEKLNQQWLTSKGVTSKRNEVQILMKICQTFKDSDRDILNGRQRDFIQLKNSIVKQLETADTKAVTRVEALLKSKNFSVLKTHMENLKAKHQVDSITYEDALQKIQDYVSEFLKDKKETLKTITLEKASVEEIPTYAHLQQELQNFLDCYEHEEVKRIKENFEERIGVLKPKLVESVENHLSSGMIGDAIKSVKQLEALERNQSSKGKEQQSLSKQYQKKIEDKINEIRRDIRSPQKYGQLKKIFIQNMKDKETHSKEIEGLYLQWGGELTKMFKKNIQAMTAEITKDGVDRARNAAEELIGYMPSSEAAENKRSLEDRYKQAVENIKANRERLNKKTQEIKGMDKLSYESIEQQVEFLNKISDREVEGELKKGINNIWDRIREPLRKADRLEQASRKFIEQIYPFVKRCKAAEKIMECAHKIENDWNQIFQELLKKQLSNIAKVWTDEDNITREKTKQHSKESADAFRDIVVCYRMAKEENSVLASKKASLEQKIHEIAIDIIKCCEPTMNRISIKNMFHERFDREAFKKFEILMRHESIIKLLRQHLSENKIDSLREHETRLKQTERFSQVSKQFVQKMDESIEFIKSLSIKSGRYDNSDEREFGSVLNKFNLCIGNVNNYMPIYEHMGLPRFNTSTCMDNLRKDVSQILAESKVAVARMKTECDDKQLKILNRNTLILSCYQNAFSAQQKCGDEIVMAINEQIHKDASGWEAMIELAKKEWKQYEEKINRMVAEERNQYQDEVEKLEKESTKQIAAIQEQWNGQISAQFIPEKKEGLQNNKKAALDTQKKDLKIKKTDASTRIKQLFVNTMKEAERVGAKTLKELSHQLTVYKQIESNLVVAKEACEKLFDNSFKKLREAGAKIINQVAKQLQELGSNYSMAIINDNPKLFKSYSMKKFKAMTANAGYEYVTDNIPDIIASERTKIKDVYVRFKKHLDMWTEEFSKTKEDSKSFIDKLKTTISKNAEELGKFYKRDNPPDCEKLLAQIFALWMIKRASVSDQQGVEYLYEPHPAQVIAMFLILGICGDKREQLGNRLAQILTGEGKSVVLGGLACYLALIGYDVSCMCYSRLLSRRDYEDFVEMFTQLNIVESVFYGTFGQVTEQLFNTKKQSLRENIKEIMLNDKKCGEGKSVGQRNKILLVDEVDVFFAKEFFGEYYTPSTEIRHKCIEDLATYVWTNRNDITYEKLILTKQFKECLAQFPRLETILDYTAVDMVSSIKNYMHSYIIHEGKIGYVLPEGISFKANYGWKTTFAYFYQSDRGTIKVKPQDYACISILCCQMSYAHLPTEFAYIMGVTGTLSILPECQKQVLKDWYKINNFFIIPSVYGKCKIEKLGAKVAEKQHYFSAICTAIKAQTQRKRPVLVFFPNIDSVNQFYLCDEFVSLKQNSMTLTERNDTNATKTRITRATRSKAITIMTKAFGRGIDFQVVEKDVQEAGGLHVIQAFISEEQAEGVQIEGRTARQGSAGTYQMIVKNEDLTAIGLTSADIEGRSPSIAADIIGRVRNSYYERDYTKQIQIATQCKQSHKTAKQILEHISGGNNDKVRSAVNNLNKVQRTVAVIGKPIKTVLGIDATGSMRSVLAQLIKNMQSCVERTCSILNEKGIKSGFLIQLAVYRNYNSDRSQLFEWSPFSNNAKDLISFLKKVSPLGGWGNEAIENLYNHVLAYETDVDQLVVIGDAPGNTQAEITQRRASKGEAYWKHQQRFASPLNVKQLMSGLVSKKIPVHNFYIGSAPGAYFKEVSDMTGGVAEQYKVNDPNATEKLTAFIVEKVLEKVGGAAMGKELVNAYRIRFG